MLLINANYVYWAMKWTGSREVEYASVIVFLYGIATSSEY